MTQARFKEKPPQDIVWDTERHLEMHPSRLEVLLRDYEEGQRRPTIRTALPWFGIGLALILGLVTGPQETLGLSKDAWKAVFIVGAAVTLGFGAWETLKSVWQTLEIVLGWKPKPPTARDMVQQVVTAMTEGQKDSASDNQPLGNSAKEGRRRALWSMGFRQHNE